MITTRLLVPRVDDGDGAADAATIAWARAVRRAFLSPDLDPGVEGRAAAWLVGERLRGAYDGDDPVPVATLRSSDARLTVPGGDVAVDAVTGIGTSPTHRRRGLVRGLLTEDLAAATEAGTPAAALTSTQGPLYERFGFGAATWTRKVRVDTARVRWRDETGSGSGSRSGSVAIVDADTFAAVAPAVAERARRRHPGSMSRAATSWAPLATGVTSYSGLTPDRTRRRLVWRDDAGTVGGYAVVRVAESWGGSASGRATIAVLDLQATTSASYRELWRHLVADDLVGTVEWDAASLDEPLPWLVTDARAVELLGVRDMLWLRVLDVAALLAARRYPVTDRFRLRVLDPEIGATGGLGAGRFVLDTTDPVAPSVARLPAGSEVDAVLPAPTLGSVALGGADPRVLARAGRLEEVTPGAAGRLARLLAAPSVPWNGVRF